MTISATAVAIGKAIEQFFSWLKESKTHQSESEIIKELKDLKKAVNIAEEIIDIAFRYIRYYNEDDRAKIRKLKKEFDKKD